MSSPLIEKQYSDPDRIATAILVTVVALSGPVRTFEL
jgi:hypothetical protein